MDVGDEPMHIPQVKGFRPLVSSSMHLLTSLATIHIIAMLPGCSTPDPVDPIIKARALIEGDKAMVAFFAHPTAALQSARYVKRVAENGGFKLIYKLDFDSTLKNPFDSTLGFVFDKNGNYQHSTVEATTSKVRPYVATTRAIPGRKYAKILEIINPDIKFIDSQGIQDFILKNGGSEAVFRETGSPWKQER